MTEPSKRSNGDVEAVAFFACHQFAYRYTDGKRGDITVQWGFDVSRRRREVSWRKTNMSVQEIIDELPKLSEQDREMILRRLVNMDEGFEPTPAMEEAIRQGMRSLREEKTYSAAEVRARIARWTAR
jgi:hypothetical protein